LFSTTIEDIPLADLKKGKVSTTGGTNISPVTAHMIKHKVKKAVFLTDGFVGSVPGEHQRKLRKLGTRINTVLTHGGRNEFAQVLKGKIYKLPLLTV
jgi:predicted metal-dependent peptidase